jgi:hypothetical protein
MRTTLPVALAKNRRTTGGNKFVTCWYSASWKLAATVLSASSKEYTEPRDLKPERDGGTTIVKLRVHPGDVRVVYFTVRK